MSCLLQKEYLFNYFNCWCSHACGCGYITVFGVICTPFNLSRCFAIFPGMTELDNIRGVSKTICLTVVKLPSDSIKARTPHCAIGSNSCQVSIMSAESSARKAHPLVQFKGHKYNCHFCALAQVTDWSDDSEG